MAVEFLKKKKEEKERENDKVVQWTLIIMSEEGRGLKGLYIITTGIITDA